MLGWLRTGTGRQVAAWAWGIGLALLLGATFLPLPSSALLAVVVPGLALFLFGAFAWLAREPGPWRR